MNETSPAPAGHGASRRAATTLVSLLFLIGCSGAPGSAAPTSTPSNGASAGTSTAPSPAIPALSKVTLEVASAAEASIGPAGGNVRASDAAGNTYALTVPPGALGTDSQIAAVPFTKIDALPSDAIVAAGVHFLPEGLRLLRPAELVITLKAPPAGGLLSFAYRGDLDGPFRYPTAVAGTTVRLDVLHFSGYGLLAATSQGIAAAELGLQLPWATPTAPTDNLLGSIAGLIDTFTPTRDSQATNAVVDWIHAGLEPMVANIRAIASWDFDGPYSQAEYELRSALDTYAYLEKLFVLAGVRIDALVASRVRDLAVSGGTKAIEIDNTDCNATPTGVLLVLRLPPMFAWPDLAARVGIGTRDPFFNRAFLVEHACVQVRYDPNGGTDFPSSIQPGQSGTLTLGVGIEVDGEYERFGDGTFSVQITPTGTSPSSIVTAATDGHGAYGTTFQWDPSAAQLQLVVKSCVYGEPDVCQTAIVVRGTAPTPGPGGGACEGRIVEGGRTEQGAGQVRLVSGTLTAGVIGSHLSGGALGSTSFSMESGVTFQVPPGPYDLVFWIQMTDADHQTDDRFTKAGGLPGVTVTVVIGAQTHAFPGDLPWRTKYTIPGGTGPGPVVEHIQVTFSNARAGDEVIVDASPTAPAGVSAWRLTTNCP